jgi:hypothetical protein
MLCANSRSHPDNIGIGMNLAQAQHSSLAEARRDGRRGGNGMPGSLNPFAGYSREERPLRSYALLIGLFHVLFAGFLHFRQGAGRPLPARLGLLDILLLGVATHKLSRLLAKDSVTSVMRAPFVEYEGPASASEVKEKPRGHGLQRALGELLICPFCLGQWVAAGLAYSLVLWPRTTHLVLAVFTALTLSDFLQYAYEWTRKQTERSPE